MSYAGSMNMQNPPPDLDVNKLVRIHGVVYQVRQLTVHTNGEAGITLLTPEQVRVRYYAPTGDVKK